MHVDMHKYMLVSINTTHIIHTIHTIYNNLHMHIDISIH
jgi:hypothetical protein